jgi:hypothetical protein
MNLSLGSHLKAFGVGAVLAVLGIGGYLWYDSRAAPEPDSMPTVTVYKTETCNCCVKWMDHLRANGFTVEGENVESLRPVKQRLNVPRGLGACHTAVVGDYVVEGHVPADEVKRLLVHRPDVVGISVPGMPIGSPGMERGDRVDPYNVLAFDTNGKASVVGEYGER